MNWFSVLGRALVLPAEISAFERRYLERVNRITLAFFLLHVPAFMTVAFFNDTGPWLALLLTASTVVGPVIAYLTFENPRRVSIVYGFTAMLMGGLLVHFGQGPVQIEMHFYFFALLAMLSLFGNPAVILTAAGTVTLHHLALWYYLPASVFNYDAPIWVVLVHAAFVVLESVATIFIARSFFDNVIGLEKIVDERTQELDSKNRQMRLVLDNVDQGLFTLDRRGVISSQRSAIVETWFGPCAEDTVFVDYLRKLAPDVAASFDLAFDQLLQDVLPIDVCLDQFPRKMNVGARHLSLAYIPILSGEELVRLLVVMSDVSVVVERELLQMEQREAMGILDRVVSDRSGFLQFLEEADELVSGLSSGKLLDLATQKRALHTLKGNAMIFGVESIGDLCHDMETRVDEDQLPPRAEDLEDLAQRWARMKARLGMVLDPGATRNIEVSPEEHAELLAAALRGAPQEQLAKMIANLKLEPTALRLRRVAEQAKRIALRLGKGDIAVNVDDQTLRLEPRRWAAFWSAFVHVVRNAVDHGLESPDVRHQLGKRDVGMINLSTRVEHGEFVVRIADDGKGVDWAAVRARARAMNLPAETQEDLQHALFADGLSTASTVTEYSGRGIGMGAVQAAFERQGGRAAVFSETGAGAAFEFRFPVKEMHPSPAELLNA